MAKSNLNIVEVSADEIAAANLAAIEAANKANEETLLGHNEGRAIFFDVMKGFGLATAKGQQSAFEMAMTFQDAVRNKYAQPTIEDAKSAVEAFRAGYREWQENNGSVGIDVDTKASDQSATSNLLSFVTPCALAWGRAFYQQIDGVIAGYASKDLNGLSKTRCYEKANKAANKIYAENMDTDALAKVVDDKWLAALLIRKGATPMEEGAASEDGAAKEKKLRTPLEQLDAARKILDKLVKDGAFGNSSELLRLKKDVAWVYHGLAREDNR